MNQEHLKIAISLSKHSSFEWMPGMNAGDPNGLYTALRVLSVHDSAAHECIVWVAYDVIKIQCMVPDDFEDASWVPDLYDPATQGCLLHMLASACNGDEQVMAELLGGMGALMETMKGESLAKALLQAWEIDP